MDKNQNIEDLKHIRSLMEKSSKFLSLSGLSGISAGIIAFIGAAIAYYLFYNQPDVNYNEHIFEVDHKKFFAIHLQAAVLAVMILFFAVLAAWYFSSRKARKAGVRLWTHTAKRTFYHFMIPLFTGGIFCISLLLNNYVHLIAPSMLVFYGLALVNSGKYTVEEVHFLGLCEIVLGLVSGFFLNHGLLFWTLGFGLLHIIYGLRMYYKYDLR